MYVVLFYFWIVSFCDTYIFYGTYNKTSFSKSSILVSLLDLVLE